LWQKGSGEYSILILPDFTAVSLNYAPYWAVISETALDRLNYYLPKIYNLIYALTILSSPQQYRVPQGMVLFSEFLLLPGNFV